MTSQCGACHGQGNCDRTRYLLRRHRTRRCRPAVSRQRTWLYNPPLPLCFSCGCRPINSIHRGSQVSANIDPILPRTGQSDGNIRRAGSVGSRVDFDELIQPTLKLISLPSGCLRQDQYHTRVATISHSSAGLLHECLILARRTITTRSWHELMHAIPPLRRHCSSSVISCVACWCVRDARA